MQIPETQKELLSYLDEQTRSLGSLRAVSAETLAHFTTVDIASELLISRTLASQYLNELVRVGLIVKAGNRPVYYFHRKSLERLLQRPVEKTTYRTVEDLMSSGKAKVARGFERAIGYDQSLAWCVEQLCAAVKYPPFGLPVLLSGPAGTGKALFAHLMLEYGQDEGIFPTDAKIVTVDCSRYQNDFARLADDYVGKNDTGLAARCAGGVLYFKDIDLLPVAAQELILSWVPSDATSQVDTLEGVATPRFVFSTTQAPAAEIISTLVRRVPMVITVPSLRDRSPEEREELTMAFIKDEGRRMGVDILISRGAFRILSNATYKGNIRGLKSCITNCCAEAYLNNASDHIEIHTYQLPPSVLADNMYDMEDIDAKLIDVTRGLDTAEEDYPTSLLSRISAAYDTYQVGGITDAEFVANISEVIRDREDYLAFGHTVMFGKVETYDRVVNDIIPSINTTYSIDLSRKSSFLISQELYRQVFPSSAMSRWKKHHGAQIHGALSVFAANQRFAYSVTERLSSEVVRMLGVEFDELTKLLVMGYVSSAARSKERRRSIGIVLCHGYSTATSMADAANRILHERIFEAIDMPYDQQVKDITGSLQQLCDRFAYCDEMAILVDMGSLEDIYKDLEAISSITLGVISNVSTALAVEVGAGLIAGRSVSDTLADAAEACQSHYRIIERSSLADAIVFCSEGGIDGAEKIKALVAQSLGPELGVRLVACGYRQLMSNGLEDAVFSTYRVRAIIGTANPKLDSIPYIALEDLIAGNELAQIDNVFSGFLSEAELSSFHRNLLKNMTLQNVVESITILNPTRLFGEIESAVRRLEQLTNERVGTGANVGLYVHLCCLVERLVTRNPIENYTNEELFASEHQDFIEAFRSSFSDIATRYHVEVPVSEIAYVYDYINSRRALRTRASSSEGLESEDEL